MYPCRLHGRRRVKCQICGKEVTLHTLAYRHVCAVQDEAKASEMLSEACAKMAKRVYERTAALRNSAQLAPQQLQHNVFAAVRSEVAAFANACPS